MVQLWTAATISYCVSFFLLAQWWLIGATTDRKISFQNYFWIPFPRYLIKQDQLFSDLGFFGPLYNSHLPPSHSSTWSTQDGLIFPFATIIHQFRKRKQHLVFILCLKEDIHLNALHSQPRIKSQHLPHIFSGASSSSRIGWLRKISLDFKHSPLISFSWSWTFLPGFDPLTVGRNQKSVTQAKSIPSIILRVPKRH